MTRHRPIHHDRHPPHFLLPDRFRYPWTENIPQLAGSTFGPDEYATAAKGAPITGTLFMEAAAHPDDAADEAAWFAECAADPTNTLLGVIACVQPEASDFTARFDQLSGPHLKGIRRVLHTEPDDLSRAEGFRQNVRELGRRGLPFDLCLRKDQLGIGLELVRACPDTFFVLNHCGVPDIAANDASHGEGWTQWRDAVRELAACPNTAVKISGILLYAAESQRNADGLRPYVDSVLEAWGTERAVWGGDWPVCPRRPSSSPIS